MMWNSVIQLLKKSIVGENYEKKPYYALWNDGHVRWR